MLDVNLKTLFAGGAIAALVMLACGAGAGGNAQPKLAGTYKISPRKADGTLKLSFENETVTLDNELGCVKQYRAFYPSNGVLQFITGTVVSGGEEQCREAFDFSDGYSAYGYFVESGKLYMFPVSFFLES